MTVFLIRRVLWGLMVVWGVTTAVFFLTMSIPSDPARMMAGPHAAPEVVEQIKKNLGLDKPMVVQYGMYMKNLVYHVDENTGDWETLYLGTSYQRHENVRNAIAGRFKITAYLAFGAVLVQLLIGLPVGIVSAAKKDSAADYTGMVGALVGISAPTFWLGVMLLFLLSFKLGAFPIGDVAVYDAWSSDGFGAGVRQFFHFIFGNIRHMVLPCLTLGVTGAAYYSRVLRSEMLEVLGQDYVRTAKAKGLSEQTVVLKHVMRNSLIPVVTLLGLDVGVLLGGAVVTESIFGLPGIGKLAIEGIFNVDVPVIMGTVLFASFLMVTANILVDAAYAVLDPRIRL